MLRAGSTPARPVGGSTYETRGANSVLDGHRRAVEARAGAIQGERERQAMAAEREAKQHRREMAVAERARRAKLATLDVNATAASTAATHKGRHAPATPKNGGVRKQMSEQEEKLERKAAAKAAKANK